MSFTHCKSYSGRDMFIGECVCRSGINPIERFCGGDRNGLVRKVPCLRTNETQAVCDKAEYPTMEEAKAEADAFMRYMDEQVQAMTVVRPAIIAESKRTDHSFGTMPCPLCNAERKWSVAPSNGHIHTRCETEGCASWIE